MNVIVRLTEKRAVLESVNETLKDETLEAWERKEYKAVGYDLEKEITRLEDHIKCHAEFFKAEFNFSL